MQNARLSALIVAMLMIPIAAAAQESAPAKEKKTFTLAGNMLEGYQNLQETLAAAADKMPEDQYGFRPTPEIKPFDELEPPTVDVAALNGPKVTELMTEAGLL